MVVVAADHGERIDLHGGASVGVAVAPRWSDISADALISEADLISATLRFTQRGQRPARRRGPAVDNPPEYPNGAEENAATLVASTLDHLNRY